MTEDLSGDGICEAGFFDIHPEDDEMKGSSTVALLGSWPSCANLKNGCIFVHRIEHGNFVVKMSLEECPKPKLWKLNSCSKCHAYELEWRDVGGEYEIVPWFLIRQNENVGMVPEYARGGVCRDGGDGRGCEGVRVCRRVGCPSCRGRRVGCGCLRCCPRGREGSEAVLKDGDVTNEHVVIMHVETVKSGSQKEDYKYRCLIM